MTVLQEVSSWLMSELVIRIKTLLHARWLIDLADYSVTGWSTVEIQKQIMFIANDRWSSQTAFLNVGLKECCLSATRVLWAEGEQNMNNYTPYIIRFGVEVFNMPNVQFNIMNDIITQAECSHNALIHSMNRVMQTVCDVQKRRQWPGLVNVIDWKTTWKTVPDPEVDHLGMLPSFNQLLVE